MNYPASFIDYCVSLKLKLTSSRKEVLYILWQAQKPLKAYEILANLLTIKPHLKPPTIYRTLEYFVANGTVHKIESIQSFTLCGEPEKQLSSEALMVCNTCHHVIEIYEASLRDAVVKLAKAHQFKLHQDAIELKGICERCSKLQ